MTEDELREYAKRLADSFPPPTPEQIVRVGEALRAGVGRELDKAS